MGERVNGRRDGRKGRGKEGQESTQQSAGCREGRAAPLQGLEAQAFLQLLAAGQGERLSWGGSGKSQSETTRAFKSHTRRAQILPGRDLESPPGQARSPSALLCPGQPCLCGLSCVKTCLRGRPGRRLALPLPFPHRSLTGGFWRPSIRRVP